MYVQNDKNLENAKALAKFIEKQPCKSYTCQLIAMLHIRGTSSNVQNPLAYRKPII